MTLHIYVLEIDSQAPLGEPVAKSADELVQLNNLLIDTQMSSNHNANVWLTDKELCKFIPQPAGGMREFHYSQDPISALEATYGSLPANLSLELVRRWLALPHPKGISLLQLLLARVLELRELELPGAVIPATVAVEAAVRAGLALEESLVRQAWVEHGPVAAIGTDIMPGPLRDPRAASSLLVMRLLQGYAQDVRTLALEAISNYVPSASGLESFLAMLELPDPRVLGSDRLASLAALLRPRLETLPLEVYLMNTSGRLKVELDVLLERLERDKHTTSLPLEAISAHFWWLLDIDRMAAANFLRFSDMQAITVRLELPPTKSETTEEAQASLLSWMDFFTHRFLPALTAWRRQGRPRESSLARALFDADAAFARWIAMAYPKLKGLPMPPLAYREIRRLSKPAAGPCIVLLIDGLAYELVEILQKEALAVGIRLSEAVPVLASLPTVTDIGMLTAVAGLPVDTAWPEDELQTEKARWRREELLRRRVPTTVVRSIFQVEQVVEALQMPSELYVLVWSDVDFLVHRYADPEMFTEHVKVSLHHILQAITQAVEEQPHLLQRKDQLRVLISADHGWTDLLEVEPIQRPEVVDARPHHRLYEVPRMIKPDEMAVLGPSWIVIAGTEFDLPCERAYLVPVENRPIERGVARQHGGLSQSEVFVPIMTGNFVRRLYHGLAVIAIPIRPLQKEQDGEISLVLSNPNESEIKSLRITCLDLDLRAQIDRIPAQSSGTFGPFPIRPRVSGLVEVVEVVLSYEGSIIGPQKLRLVKSLNVERTPEERMAGDYSRVDSLFE